MIGSLAEFLELGDHPALNLENYQTEEGQLELKDKTVKKQQRLGHQDYPVSDKRTLLAIFAKSAYKLSHDGRFRAASEGAATKCTTPAKHTPHKYLVQHRSFFVKTEAPRDEIAKSGLRRKHNLLRAIVRMKQTEEEPKISSDYEQSFQRLYAGFNTIKPHAVLKSSRAGYEQLPESVHVSPIRIEEKAKSKLSNHRRIQYQNCAIWAKKHNKNGDFFLQQLGHIDEDTLKGVKNKERFSRAILEDIAKRIGH